MKKVSLVSIGLVGLLASNLIVAGENTIDPSTQNKAVKLVKQQVATCNRTTQYFEFNDAYASETAAFYMLSEGLNSSNTLGTMRGLPKGKSQIFTNTFTGFPAMHTGALHVIKSATDGVTFCSLTFACDCPANANYCYTEAITNGVHCTLDGMGSENDPFVINIQ